jgi:hypothetical protein
MMLWRRNQAEISNLKLRFRTGSASVSVSFHPGLLANSLAGQGFFHSPLLAWFQIEGMALDLLNDVLLLDLALEPAKSVFQRLAFLKSYFSHLLNHPASLHKVKTTLNCMDNALA